MEKITFDSGKVGKKLLIFGAMHGNEVCGPLGIQRITDQLESGSLTLISGSVTFVPVCNPAAYAAGKRMLEQNLNRICRKTEHPVTNEEHLANELCALIDAHDALLDIHSTAAEGPFNLFIDYPTRDNQSFADALGAEVVILDWPAVYANSAHNFDSYTSDWYAHEAGKIGILIECGQHTDPHSIDVAEQSILRTLMHFGILSPATDMPVATAPKRTVVMTHVFKKENENDQFVADFNHLQLLPTGTAIAERANGEKIYAEVESVIIFPKTYAVAGAEWFYLGLEKNT